MESPKRSEMTNNAFESDIDVAKELLFSLNRDSSLVETYASTGQWRGQTYKTSLVPDHASFAELDLYPEIVGAINRMGYDRPSRIQNLAIPVIINRDDVAVQSKSGTGKTLAFCCGVAQTVKSGKGPQAVIITPTRELNVQVAGVMGEMGSYLGLTCFLAAKGSAPRGEATPGCIRNEIIVGSPGSILAHLKNKSFEPSNIKIVVIDEADAVLDLEGMGSQTQRILRELKDSHKVFFSATYSPQIKGLIQSLITPKRELKMIYEEKNAKPDEIKLYYIELEKSKKIETLINLYGYLSIGQSIIFVGTRIGADNLRKRLELDKYTVSSIHGEMDVKEREKVVDDFRNARTKILISTDIFSRGMDIPQVNLIVNFDLPIFKGNASTETYIHRIGRSGRFGRDGFVIDFVTNAEELAALIKFHSELKSVSKKFTMEAIEKAFDESLNGI
ncbi:ATP-dependent RNA helicase DBP5 [Astathelohania contejeani]|uniref:RNA helicase n=1 Tax=Astathelohania contejeani TaxID=164912 RepID=A0ABQ7HZA3_9MICR|nr:ATP-dependent RNA helicase DBP5 [Thelohania contejeani]